ncbi:hypothetical protein BDW02DRAFT_220514 [Decorospora gaudefroyi]|uniref:RING-type domain-containing protein n=1 Tax=Decorospora gaudefroyi TaxID=184978 RepID=A0A6A5KHI8_9PLEO|nr:hypothetical protein BDW02DRAFT_220514 [Decorospora gaudefroyi]
MENRTSTPPATRPKNSSSSMTSSNTTPTAATTTSQSATMPSNSRTARGSTPTASRSASKLGDADKALRAASRDSLKQKMLKKDETPQPSRSEEQLKALKSEFDSLRSHLTCKICDRLLYQPYTISCGHTYCYTCLCTWFVSNKARKTCPDCRIVVKELPAPAYVIRDMTGVFIARAELLPPGESIEDHSKWLKDEADAVQLDKDNKDPRTGGLFKGCFRHTLHARGPSLQVVRDQEDGVDRCPVCTWELEDGGCTQCGLIFDETGEVSWGDSFTGFSDMDEMSEHDTEDVDAEMDDMDFDGYDDGMDEWGAYPPDQGSFMMRRFLEAGMAPNAVTFTRRRPITHSEAGSRRSYSQSIVSDMYGDEMDTVEEEDEDGLDQDSSMNDFIDDEAVPASSSASNASATPGPMPQPSNNRARAQGRVRRIVESETSSTVSSAIEEEEDDEENQGPIRRGMRNPAQTRVLHRANGSRSSHETASSTSTDVSTEELDEDTQALLREEGWMLQRDDDEMGEEDEDDSDGGRTTVGWEPLANSNDRSRMGGSLTPTADRPRPSAPIRPPSRTGQTRALNTSRGLRRRSSVLSTSTAHYEDGEADDDDSDQDGDIDLAMDALRTRRSQAQMRNMAAFSNPAARFHNRGPIQGDAANELDTDDNSDNSQHGNGRGGPRVPLREYDPRISWMFAAHQQALQQHQMAGALIDVEPRSITPLARPRTRNRNRPSPAQAFSPFLPPARLRTPLMDNTSNLVVDPRMPVSPPRRSAMSPGLPTMANTGNMSRFDRAPSVSSNSNTSTILTPGTSTPSSQHSIDNIAQTQAAAAMDMIDRPQSRVSARPTSATGRRNSAGFPTSNPSFPHASMGLHVQGAALPPFTARGNPWAAFVQARGVRNRNSRQLLREQSSVATLRPASSRVNIREAGNPPQAMRPQPSRINLRTQPSRRQLNNQSSTRTLRASEHARPPPSPSQNMQAPDQPAVRPVGLTPDERNLRARELIETRRQALGQRDSVPARTNPFTQGFQRPVNGTGTTQMQQPPTAQHVRSNSNESVNSTGTVQGAPASPGLSRRRSNRNMVNAPPPGVLPPTQGVYTAPATAYTNSYYRPRQGSLNSAPVAYESTLTGNTRGMNPMMAGPLI